MGFHGLKYFAPYQINIIKMTWAGANHQDRSLGKYWLMRQFPRYRGYITTASYAKLLTDKGDNYFTSYFSCITDKWSLCGCIHNLYGYGYENTDVYVGTESGSLLFALPACVAGKFPLDKNNPKWGYFQQTMQQQNQA